MTTCYITFGQRYRILSDFERQLSQIDQRVLVTGVEWKPAKGGAR